MRMRGFSGWPNAQPIASVYDVEQWHSDDSRGEGGSPHADVLVDVPRCLAGGIIWELALRDG